MNVAPIIRRVSLRTLSVALFVSLALLTSTHALYADTVTIVDGDGATNTGPNIFDDAFIETQLAAGDFTIDTLNANGGGPDDLHMEPGAVITWTNGSSLTLIAQQHIVVSGTIQHDGLTDGSGGVQLLADSDVILGQGTQPFSITVGSRFGLTRLDGDNIELHAGDASGPARSVLVGFRAFNQGETYAVSGPISVTANLSVIGEAGADLLNFVQIGHGGSFSNTTDIADGLFIGDIAITAGSNISFTGGINDSTYVQIGNGGISTKGNHGGSHTLNAGGDITFAGGIGGVAYAQVGNGGFDADGSHSGSHLLNASGPILFTAGNAYANYAQAGNGGFDADGSHSGDLTLNTDGAITFTGGLSIGSSAYAQAGNGGFDADGSHSGSNFLDAGGPILFTAGNAYANYAQAGNGGFDADAPTGHSGNLTLATTSAITFTSDSGGGSSAYAQAGNGGYSASGNHSGSHRLDTGGSILFTAGLNSANYAQFGNGGYDADAPVGHSGSHTVIATGDIIFTARGVSNGYAQVGNGGYSASGSHSGSHLLNAGGSIVFTGGSGTQSYAQAGNGGFDADAPVGHSGSHTVIATGDIIFTARGVVNGTYAQVGNGGYGASGSHSGSHLLNAGGSIAFTGGSGPSNYAQVGNGGYNADAPVGHSGNHSLNAGGPIVFTGGPIVSTGGSGVQSYAQVGNGGFDADAPIGHSGNLTVTTTSAITFTGGFGSGTEAYAQVGNGGYSASGSHSGDLILDASGTIVFRAGSAHANYAQVGNGGYGASGSHSGDLTVTTTSAITFTGGFGNGTEAYAQVGNGGYSASGSHSGDLVLDASGTIAFRAGSAYANYAQVGNGGFDADAPSGHSGDQTLNAGGAISFVAGSGFDTYAQAGNGGDIAGGNHSGDQHLTSALNIILTAGSRGGSYAQVGNGGSGTNGNLSGSIELTAIGSLSMTGGVTTTAYAQIGHGADVTNTTGTRSGDITVRLDEDLLLNGAQIGHVSGDGPEAITSGNTFIAVSLNNPYSIGSGQILATNTPTSTVGFNSAHSPLGELRFYVPDQFHVSIPVNTPMNSEFFPGFVSADRLAGYYFFANGPYIAGADYAFYFGDQTDLSVSKAIEPTGVLMPGQPLTFTISFSNTSQITAPNALLTDALPGLLTTINLSSNLDPGVVITQTGSAPNLSWDVSDLGPNQGGQIFIQTNVPLLGVDTILTNTTDISSTRDITLSNNSASASASVIVPRVQFAPAAYSLLESAGPATVTVTLDIANPYAAVLVTVATSDNSALAGSDYTTVNQPLSIPAGISSVSLPIPLLNDSMFELDELFSVTLSSPVAATLGAASSASVLIRNDDQPASLSVSKVANVDVARVGETITYTYRITNTGPLTFTSLAATDDKLGNVTLTPGELGPGDVATAMHTYTVDGSDLPGPLANTVNVTGTAIAGPVATGSATASVSLVNAAFAFTKTVGIQGFKPECTNETNFQVPISTTIVYCFTIVNTGSIPLTHHTLQDSQLGTVLNDFAYNLTPGATFMTTMTRTLFVSDTNVAVWTAGYAGSDEVSAAAIPFQSTTQATVRISGPTDDQDSDGTPDNVEGAGDVDGDGIPNFLDPSTPTGSDPDLQPSAPTRIFLPNVSQS